MCRGTRCVPEVTTETMRTSPKARLFVGGDCSPIRGGFSIDEDIIPIAPVTGAKVKERWIKCDERRRFLGYNRGSSQLVATHSGFLRRSRTTGKSKSAARFLSSVTAAPRNLAT